MNIVVATRNVKKGGEMVRILSEFLGGSDSVRTADATERVPPFEVLTLAGYPEFPEPEETGATYAENAVIKAEAAAAVTGEVCIADDAGLEIDALGGQPGLHSKRFEGADRPFDEKIAIILDRMRGLPEEQRTARFRCAVAVSPTPPHAVTKVFESTREGLITTEPRGTGGFGYDPIFMIPELGKTFAELAPEEKNAVSHRGIVLREAAARLLENFGS